MIPALFYYLNPLFAELKNDLPISQQVMSNAGEAF